MKERTILAQLLDTVVVCLRRYVVLTPEQSAAIALWIAHTHVFTSFRFTPYLSVQSATKQSGKTRLLETIRPLAANPLDTDGMSPAALVRTVDSKRPSLLLDEADASFNGNRELAEALRGILNSGFRSRGNVVKCVGEGANMTTKEFSTFCPKAIAGIGRLPDTVADRSIPIKLRRRAPDESIAEMDEEAWEFEAEPIANGLRDALAPEAEKLANAQPQRPDGVSDRAKDAWKPLLAIAGLAGGEWPDQARAAAVALCGSRDVTEEEVGVRLIADVRAAFANCATDRLMTSELLEYLHSLEDSPWADWSRGTEISARKVADLLRPFDLRSKDMRFESGVHKGFSLDACEDAFRRWLPPEGDPIRNTRNNGSSKPHSGVFQSATSQAMLRIENGQKPHEKANVAGVADTQAPTGEDVPIATPEQERMAAALGTSFYDEEGR